MILTGIIKDSFQEYEGEHSLVLFCYSCNYACPECHNYKRIMNSDNIMGSADDTIEYNLNVLHSAVVFLGGEPTIYKDLYDLCKYVKRVKKRKVKIFTNGSNFELIKQIFEDGYLDSISIDLKCVRNCRDVVGADVSDEVYLDNINKHIELFKTPPNKKNIIVELRTTLWDNIQDQLEDIEKYVDSLNLPKNFKHIKQRKI